MTRGEQLNQAFVDLFLTFTKSELDAVWEVVTPTKNSQWMFKIITSALDFAHSKKEISS